MSDYHINLPQGLVLTVEIEDTPIKMHITFPQGKRVTFDYRGDDGERRAHVKEHSVRTPIDKPPATHLRKDRKLTPPLAPLLLKSVAEAPASAAIEFIDPEGSEM